jgi:hypothetical protein
VRHVDSHAAHAPPPVAPPPPPPHPTHKLLFVAAGLLLLFSLTALAAVGYFVWKRMSEKPAPVIVENINTRPTPRTTTPTPAPTPTPPAATRLSLEYSLIIQMMRNDKPYKGPLESTGRERYENGTTFRLNVLTPGPGFLYLLSEGPNDEGDIIYSVLYPTPDLSGNARIEGGQAVIIPGEHERPFVFKGGKGTEKMWIIFSEEPVRDMEALKGLMNEENNWGDVTDPAQIKTVRDFLSKHQTAKTESVEDKDKNKMSIKSSDEVLIYRSDLEHY